VDDVDVERVGDVVAGNSTTSGSAAASRARAPGTEPFVARTAAAPSRPADSTRPIAVDVTGVWSPSTTTAASGSPAAWMPARNGAAMPSRQLGHITTSAHPTSAPAAISFGARAQD
jgi:hypothetical protein